MRHLHKDTAWVSISFFLMGLLMLQQAKAFTVPGKAISDSLEQTLTKPIKPVDRIATMIALGKEYYAQSKLDNAIKVSNQALTLISEHGTVLDSAKCYRLIGLVYLQKAWYDKSLAYLMEAQSLGKRSGDKVLYAKALMNVGIVHDCMKNLPMSLDYYKRALKIFEQEKYDSGVADCKLNISVLQSRQKQFTEAGTNLLEAAGIYKKLGRNTDVALAYFNLGTNYKRTEKFDSAIIYHNKARDIWEKLDDQYHLSAYYINMGEIMLSLNRLNDALPYLRMSEKLSKEVDARENIFMAYESLAHYYAALKDYRSAYLYKKKAAELNDSLLNAETTEKVNQIQYQYEIARREAENEHLTKLNLDKELQISEKNIVLYLLSAAFVITALLIGFLIHLNRMKKRANHNLEEKNHQIEIQKSELIRLNASKDKFLTILAHDIKNPAGTMMGISDLLSEKYDTLPDHERRQFIDDSRTLSKNLYNIVNTLLSWAISQGGLMAIHAKNFDISELTSKATANLAAVAAQKEISLLSQMPDNILVHADDNMIITVLHNLISNAIKFSHKHSNVLIETRKSGNSAEISVTDTGIGIPEDKLNLLFRYDQHHLTKGTAGETGTGLGLILCKDFVEKNGGTIRAESTSGEGSRFIFTLPLAAN